MILGIWEKNAFFSFIEICTLWIAIFRFFRYITLVNFCFQATGHIFAPRDVIFVLRGPFTIRKKRRLTLLENFIFYGWIGQISVFKSFCYITLVIIEISMACGLSFKAIFSNNYDGNKYILFRTSMIQGGISFIIFNQFLRDLWKGSCEYRCNHGMWYINLVYFFLN